MAGSTRKKKPRGLCEGASARGMDGLELQPLIGQNSDSNVKRKSRCARRVVRVEDMLISKHGSVQLDDTQLEVVPCGSDARGLVDLPFNNVTDKSNNKQLRRSGRERVMRVEDLFTHANELGPDLGFSHLHTEGLGEGSSSAAQHTKSKILERMLRIHVEAWRLPDAAPCIHCGAKRFHRESPGFCCGSGKIVIHLPRMPKELWHLYVADLSPLGVHFRTRCRTYNNSMAFTSIQMTYDINLARANRGVYTFRVNGAMYHYVRELIPSDGFARQVQLYFYGAENELENRLAQCGGLEAQVIALLVQVLGKVNPYDKFFRRASELSSLESYKIILRGDPSLDQRVYSLPIVDHVAAIWNEQIEQSRERPRDIQVYLKSGSVNFVQYYYGCYDPLQYPLLFPYAEPGWHEGIEKQASIDDLIECDEVDEEELDVHSIDPAHHSNGETLLVAEENNVRLNKRKKGSVSMREYYCYLFQIRPHVATNILRTGRLVQQFQIDMYVKIETQRLDYLRHSQDKWEMRAESYQGIIDSMDSDGMTHGSSVGQRVILPASFIGGPRDLRRRYMNALALVLNYGRPDFFVTMTCNPKWAEIQEELFSVESAQNRADLYARVFRAKNEELRREIVEKKLFGEVAAYFYVVEFQKRGLPHVHWLIILKPQYKISCCEAYDRFVSAEIPNRQLHPHLHSCVMSHMMHGPCGELNDKNVCMRDNKCKSCYPKNFTPVTEHRKDSYPAYRRRDNGARVFVRGHWLDNRWVIPYNPYLLAKFDCHINIEVCADIRSVKYLYKYVCKGNDKIAYNIVDGLASERIDEIKNFQSARWVCAPESMWRIYGFDMCDMYPPVLQLHVHLPGMQRVYFSGKQPTESIVGSSNATKTQLTEFFAKNRDEPEVAAMNLLYRDFPAHFVWSKSRKEWTKRLRGFAIGRLVSVSMIETERYYLRLLLNHVRAPTSFEYLKTSNGVLFSSFREAALDRGLLDSDNDVRGALEEACSYQLPYSLRRFFAMILVYNCPCDPAKLWQEFRDELCADIMRGALLCDDQVNKLSLQSMDVFLQSMGHGIDEYSLVPFKIGLTREEMYGRDFQAERNFIVSDDDLASVNRLNVKQKEAFDKIMESVDVADGAGFFVDGPGGTGKTYLYRAILATIRSTGGIALAVASSGVAASLLPGGRTAHSRFKLPIKINEVMSCSISKQSALAHLIISAKLIIWDEASMTHRKTFEALDLLLKDLMESTSLFGGKTVVLGGDFRQTIPIVKKGSREDVISACLVNSTLWPLIQKLHLTENMRAKDDPVFTEYLLRVGNGTEPFVHDDYIRLPKDMCLPHVDCDSPLDVLVDEIFPSFDAYETDPFSVMNRAILTPKNDCMDEINDTLINKFPGDLIEYVSTDLTDDPSQQCQYQDFMNAVNVGGLPPHVLRLKKNCPVIMIRNLNPLEGLCNGTRMIIRDLGKKVIGAVIASGEHIGKYVFIPRIPLELSDNIEYPIPFKRHQFPIRLCFAMSINKAQGQTLDQVGIYLPCPVFSHGQLYVALSRVRKGSSVRVLIRPPIADIDPHCETKNVVYPEILHAAT